MSLSLVTRSGNGAPVTAAQNDANMNAIQSAVNTNTANIATKVSNLDFFGYFNSIHLATGKMQVGWADLINMPTQFTNAGVSRGVKTDASQTISASGSLQVHFNTIDFDYTGCFNSGTYRFTAPFNGVYCAMSSVQVSLASGSPTNVSIVVSLRVNGAPREQATLDNTGTGTRIYKCHTLANLTATDYFDVVVDFTFSGTATWQIDGNNTTLSVFRVNTN